MSHIAAPTRSRRVAYPESDGKPLGETDLHRDLMTDLIFALKLFLANVRAYVAGNLFIYYQEGNAKAVVAPDVFVVLGAEQRRRRVYKAWQEGNRLPSVVIELTSKKTAEADRKTKPELYARLGVREYFLFDPYGEHLNPSLQGYRLAHGVYEPMQEYPLRSAILGLELRVEENTLRLYNSRSGVRLATPAEVEQARRAAEERLQVEVAARYEAEAQAAEQVARAAEAEAEVERLRALLAQQAEQGKHP